MTRRHSRTRVHFPDLETDGMYLSVTGTHNAACPSRKESAFFNQPPFRPFKLPSHSAKAKTKVKKIDHDASW